MSENITHTAIVDDSLRLARAAGWLAGPLAKACEKHPMMPHLGGVTRHGDFHSVGLLTTLRDRSRAGELTDRELARLAFILGWLSHRAADRQMKPVFRGACPNPPETPTDCSIYNDAFLFHEIYASGRQNPYHEALFTPESHAAAAGDAAAMEELLGILIRRYLIAMHTFIPDDDDAEGWLDRLHDLTQWATVNLRRYAEAIADPDPAKVRRYIRDTNFYDAVEAIIAAARRLRKGEALSPAEVAAAVDAAAASHYAGALKTACGYLRATGAFFAGKLEPEALRERFDIGKPGRDGKVV
jgi:hypothetical protein